MTFALRILFGLACLFFLANQLLMNDVILLWSGAESTIVAASLDEGGAWLPQIVLHIMLEATSSTFWIRFPSTVIFLMTLVISYLWLRPMFGKMTALLTIWLIGASLMVPVLGKIATADSWAFASLWLALLALLRYLKAPVLKWRIFFYVIGLLAIWIHPLSSSVGLLIAAFGLYRFHPQGPRMISLAPWVLVMLFLPLFYFTNWGAWGTPSFSHDYFNQSYFRYLAYALLGTLPFIGFVFSGLWESFQKAKKGEELAIINGIIVVAALFSQSMALHAAFALIAAKQLQSYFVQNYPYRSIVKTATILHLVLTFCAITIILMGAFYEFRGVGFRSVLAAGGVYWMASFLGVIGIYGMNRRLVWTSALMTGLLAAFLYWIQISPLVETQRKWVAETISDGESKNIIWESPYDENIFPNLKVLAQMAGKNVIEYQEEDEFPAEAVEYLLTPDSYKKMEQKMPTDSLSGWADNGKPIIFYRFVAE